MHIVIDAHLAVKEIDGVTRYLIGLLSELPKQDKSIQYTIIELPKNKSGLPNRIFDQSNVRRFEIDLMGPSPRLHLIMNKLLKELKADLYHHPQFDLPFGVRIPSVITIHDLKYLFHPEFLRKRTRLKSFYIKKSLQYSIRRANKIIVVSKNTLNDLRKLFNLEPEKVEVVHHGVEPPLGVSQVRSNHSLNIENDFILYVGTRRPHKNIEGLIKALAILRRDYNSEVDLVVSGKAYSDYNAPEVLATEIGIDSYVHFLNFVPDKELTFLYQSARMVALVSYYEGFGLPLLEGMAHGKPVIGSNVSSIPEVIGDCGLLVDPNKPDEIAKKIHQVLTDQKLYHMLSKAGLMHVKKFSWSKVAEKTLEVYFKALNQN